MDTQYPSSGVFDVSDYQAFSSKLNILFCVPYVMNVSQYVIASFAGKTLTFTIDGVDTMQTAIWATGGNGVGPGWRLDRPQPAKTLQLSFYI